MARSRWHVAVRQGTDRTRDNQEPLRTPLLSGHVENGGEGLFSVHSRPSQSEKEFRVGVRRIVLRGAKRIAFAESQRILRIVCGRCPTSRECFCATSFRCAESWRLAPRWQIIRQWTVGLVRDLNWGLSSALSKGCRIALIWSRIPTHMWTCS